MGIRHALGVVLLVASFTACGPKPPPDDATTTKTDAPKDDGTTGAKWEGASAEDKEARQAGPPAGTPPPTPTVGQNRTDTYDKEQTEIVLRRASRQVKEHCGEAKDENGKATGPWGKTSVSVNLGHNGRSKGATIQAPYDGKPTGRCAVKAFSSLTVPPWSGTDTTIEWEIEIVQPGK
jgi:predicted small lipoprotein YifL